MTSPEAEASDVELTSLVREDTPADDHDGDEHVAPQSSTGSRASSPLGSGYPGRDVLLFVLGLAAGISAVAAVVKFVSSSPKTASNGTDASTGVAARWEDTRWEPLSTNWSANCIPRFRLANATIHCGVGGVSPVTNSSDGGHQLCGGVRMEPNYCILPIEGSWSMPPSPAPPLARRFGVESNRSSLPRCTNMNDLLDGEYEYEGDKKDLNGEWVPKNCSVVKMSPFAWTKNSKCETTITMIGDSHIRNLFTATINGLRGIKHFTEAHADDGNKARGIASSYEWRLSNDGIASDHLDWHSNIKAKNITPFEDCPCGEVRRCLRVAFIWAPTFGEQLSVIRYATEWKTDVLIVEPGNAYEQNTVLAPTWTEKLDSMLDEDANLQIGVLHFIWGRQPAGRTEALKEWVGNGTLAGRKSYLGQGSMSPGTLQGRKTFHFACGLDRASVGSDTITAAEPCTDLADTMQMRALITVHFDALLN